MIELLLLLSVLLILSVVLESSSATVSICSSSRSKLLLSKPAIDDELILRLAIEREGRKLDECFLILPLLSFSVGNLIASKGVISPVRIISSLEDMIAAALFDEASKADKLVF
jgi:hypothetical protein